MKRISSSDSWHQKTSVAAALLILVCAGCRQHTTDSTVEPAPPVTFKPQEMADALHAVIAADREVYTTQVMKLGRPEATPGSSAGRQKQAADLPLPAHLLRLESEAVQKNGAEFHYVLRSLRPINSKNGPQTEVEKTGLQFVAQHPDTNYYAEESLGGRRYLTAVYPDRVISPACADCHNQQNLATKENYKPGDVIGGIIVRVPLEF